MDCPHEDFVADVVVARMEDTGRYMAEVRIVCQECKTPFRFIGLPAGVDMNGASVSVDGCEARLAIAPKGEVVPPLENTATGFTVRRLI
jgi:hypothetical protein